MRCRTVLTRIDALRTGELPAQDESEMHEHFRGCKSCEDSVEDVTGLARAVKSLAVAPPKTMRGVLKSIADGLDSLKVDDQTIWVGFSDKGLRMITLDGSAGDFRSTYCARFGRALQERRLPERLRKQVVAAVSGEGCDRPEVDLPDATEFERSVLKILTRIPRGEVRTYAWVARQAGRPKAIRAVGSICRRNVVPFVVPCHRVVPTSGGVGQYALGVKTKRALLEREGVVIEELETLGRKGVRFIGSKTTKIFCFPTCRDARRIRDENRVPFRGAQEAMERGFRACRRCQPIAA